MRKPTAKSVLKVAKANTNRKWEIVSYSIDRDVLKAFKRACKDHGVKGSQLIERFMADVIALN
jgi:antitoxin component of RelBE/YafQ-DinJ toxin-antitoxin module